MGVVAATLSVNGWLPGRLETAVPNLLLIVIYGAIGYFLARTQIANRRPLGGWSLSGLALAVVFPTCAAMHGIYGYYELTGLYPVPSDTPFEGAREGGFQLPAPRLLTTR